MAVYGSTSDSCDTTQFHNASAAAQADAMRREARAQAKDRRQPDTPHQAHSRAVQAAVKEMRDKLYAKKGEKGQRSLKQLNRSASAEASTCRQGRSCSIVRPPPRHHPP